MGRIFRIFIAGLLVLLPILVTVMVTIWVAQLLHGYAGPNSLAGKFIVSLGANLVSSRTIAYFFGLLIVLSCIFLLGLIVESRLRPLVQGGLDGAMMRIPILSNIYDLSKRFVAIVDRRGGDKDDLKSMSPVWCFFGGEGGAAVLALMPSHEPVIVGEHSYLGVLIPSAPVPFGGARPGLCAGRVGQTGRRRRRAANERLCVDGLTPPVSRPLAAKPALIEARAVKPRKAPKAT